MLDDLSVFLIKGGEGFVTVLTGVDLSTLGEVVNGGSCTAEGTEEDSQGSEELSEGSEHDDAPSMVGWLDPM